MILIVDDEADLARTCERLLRRGGHDVATATSCAAALTALAAGSSCLLVCDVRLPDGDGLDVVRAAQRLDPPVPAIVMTGQPSEAGRLAAFASGAAAYLSKPFSAAAFAALVDRTLARR
ncbi:MAG TPA: response regulator [Methylomirabilota bacterium]|nr:response regulator [Methylomirabilota bacterium]